MMRCEDFRVVGVGRRQGWTRERAAGGWAAPCWCWCASTLRLVWPSTWPGSAQDACREARLARGEFVEPEVFPGPLGLFFDVTWWPVYAWANVYHFTPFRHAVRVVREEIAF